MATQMVDSAEVRVKSGNGGDGAVSGRREKYIPHGGPDGGNGGDGGSVRFVCDASVNTLLAYRYRREFSAGSGGNGSGNRKHGKRGADIDLTTPVGTVVSVLSGQRWRLAADLASPGQAFVVPGGRGGRGNVGFATPTNRFPLLAERGEQGSDLRIQLELKLLADVGIIGLPNAGKSSLLAALTSARPKIAEYPFSTLEPVLGVAERSGREMVLVDIPGLIEGAHQGVGLGHDFLRHIERTRVIIHVLDGSSDDPYASYCRIREELGLYDSRLAAKPEVVALNKSDVQGVKEKLAGLQRLIPGVKAHSISAAASFGLGPMLDDVQALLASSPIDQPAAEPNTNPETITPKPVDDAVKVSRVDGRYVVSAGRAGRVAAMVDSASWEAKSQLYGYLERVGVISALRKMGIGQGDTFTLGGKEWTWE